MKSKTDSNSTPYKYSILSAISILNLAYMAVTFSPSSLEYVLTKPPFSFSDLQYGAVFSIQSLPNLFSSFLIGLYIDKNGIINNKTFYQSLNFLRNHK